MAAARPGSPAPRRLPPSTLLLLAAVLLAASPPARALRFDLESGHTKCISDEIKVDSMAVGKYSVVAPDPSYPDAQLPESHRVSLRVTSPYGNSMHYSENVQSGHFAFTAVEAGDYLACFWAPDQGLVQRRQEGQGRLCLDTVVILSAPESVPFWLFYFMSRGLPMMELELKKLEDTIKSIHEEMFYLREREANSQIKFFACHSSTSIFKALGGANAEHQQADELEDGVAEFPLTWHLLIRGRAAAVASEDLFREKEVAVVSPMITNKSLRIRG
uniref:Transmembrane emp24 domain-containing protein 10 n=1 Tax=Aegilops tauschii TaxID=37682 RepID=M8B013_AEGTA